VKVALKDKPENMPVTAAALHKGEG